MQVRSLSREDTLEEGMATHSSFLARRILWTEEPGGGGGAADGTGRAMYPMEPSSGSMQGQEVKCPPRAQIHPAV